MALCAQRFSHRGGSGEPGVPAARSSKQNASQDAGTPIRGYFVRTRLRSDLADLVADAARARGLDGMNEKAKGNGGVSADTFNRLRALETENELLRIGLDSRVVLEQAKGAISARRGVTPDVAFEMMRRLARSQRREIHGVAREIVANGGRLSIEE